tara:strand:- start:465 stop:1790 length:1326 start_codon:yes stop_codon:yes gene_type:complete
MIKNFNLVNIVLLLILIILINKIISVFISFENYANFNELFINYEAGFLRRGLLGQVAFFFFKKFSLSPIIFFSIIFCFANSIFFILFIKCINKFKDNLFLYFFLLLSPATLMFGIFDSVNFFSSQIFLLISILLHTFIAIKYLNDFKKYKIYFLYLILPILFVNIFQYDPQILTLSSHIFVTYFVITKNNLKNYKLLSSYLILIIPIFMIVSNNGTTEQILSLEKMKEIVNENYSFIISAHPESFSMINSNDLGGNLNLKIGAMIKIFGIYFGYDNKLYLLYAFILTIIFFIIYFGYFVDKNIYLFKINYKFTIISFLPLLSLFLFITDFGRSIHIFLIHLLAILFLLEIDKDKEKRYLKKMSFIKKGIFLVFLIIYSNTWTLSHATGWTTIFNPGGPKYANYSSYIKEFKKIIFNSYYYTDKYILELPKGEFMKPFLQKK